MKISVALCTYNGEKYLQEQLQSISAQTRPPDEIVIIDDHSDDDTWSIIREFAQTESRVVSSRNATNIGAKRNFESAIARCTGDIVFLSDQDDIWRADKTKTVLKAFEDHHGATMVFSDAEVVDENKKKMPLTLWQSLNFTGRAASRYSNDPFVFLLLERNIVTGATAAFTTAAIRKALPFPETMSVFVDGWLALVATAIGPVVDCKDTLISYRQHAEQQIGVRHLSPDFGVSDYECHYRQLVELRSRVAVDISQSHLNLLDNYIKHLSQRLNLSSDVIQRGGQVLDEIVSGRYSRFSSGWRSAAKDFMRKDKTATALNAQ